MENVGQKKYRKINSIQLLSLIVLCITTSLSTFGQNYEVLSPERGDTINADELFIALRIPPEDTGRIKRVTVMLDDAIDLSGLVRIKGDLLTIYYPSILNPHSYTIEVSVKYTDKKERYYVANWLFYVRNEKNERKKAIKDGEPVKPITTQIKGHLTISSRDVFLSGPGQELRQEPSSTRIVNLSVTPKVGNFEFPIKLRYNSLDVSTLQSRNRFLVGVRTKNQEVLYGDHYIHYDKLVFNGARVRGLKVTLGLNRQNTLSVVNGTVQRGIEGSIHQYNPTALPPSPLLSENSTYISPGVYKRNLLGVRLRTNPETKLSSIGLSFVKSKDEINSIQYAVAPKENIAFGTDYFQYFFKRKVKIDMGAAVSATTHDISGGVMSQQEINDTYGVEVNYDPNDYRQLITINSSTTPLGTRNLPFISWYVKARVKLKSNQLTIGSKKVGAGFMSFANPYLRTDRWELFARDRISLLKKKVNLTLDYKHFQNNLAELQTSTRFTNSMGGNLGLNISKKLPVVNLGYRFYLRHNSSDVFGNSASDDIVNSMNASINYQLKTGDYKHRFGLSFSQTNSEYAILPNNVNQYSYLSLNIQEQFPFKLNVGFQVSKILLSYYASPTQETQLENLYINANAKYRFAKDKVGLKIRFGNYISSLSDQSTSTRIQLAVGGDYKLSRAFQVQIEGGIAPFNSQDNPSEDYNETFIFIKLKYDFLFSKK